MFFTINLPDSSPRDDPRKLLSQFGRQRGCAAHDHPNAAEVVVFNARMLQAEAPSK